MNTKLTQRDFDAVAASWTAFIDGASPEKVQALFQFASPNQSTQYQTFARFDLATTIPQLLSTVGIRQVMARFVLLPKDTSAGTPRFRTASFNNVLPWLLGLFSAYALFVSFSQFGMARNAVALSTIVNLLLLGLAGLYFRKLLDELQVEQLR